MRHLTNHQIKSKRLAWPIINKRLLQNENKGSWTEVFSSKLPSGVSTGWTVVADGASVSTVGASDTVKAVVAAPAVPTSVETVAASVTPGAGVAELKGPSFVVLASTGDSVAA